MKYLFVLGRNIELSKQELLSYFEKERNSVLSYHVEKNGMLIDLEKAFNPEEIKRLGGTISVGEVLVEDEWGSFKQALDKEILYEGESNKLTYVLWGFSKHVKDVAQYLRDRFKEEKLKTAEKHLTDFVKMQGGDKMKIPSSKLLDEEYFVFDFEEKVCFGKIITRYDAEEVEQRDMEKPVRRESLAISPRLAKILINLAQVRSGDTLLDPFCGVGVILEEALRQGINVVGVDKDEKAIEGARKNLEWFGFDSEKYLLINFDSTKVNIPEVKAVATEPDLGEVLKKIPTGEKAEGMLKGFEKLMVKVINNCKGKIEGRIVFTSPLIRIGKKRLACDIENICSRTGYKEVFEGIEEFRHNQVVGRKIFVLEKSN